ncbi:hypothetical protein D6D24_05300 [Aureobasidium pullulans]|uniref:Histidine kinase HHK15p n=1 Tax=Aureobasidium pullulans TaxID=5580 RepID=A0A4S8VS53_AURPU|nr:hypothetical protein D6D24_05300 [Aureobasidium pullulans]
MNASRVPPPGELVATTLLEYLQHDNRPTFIIDLADANNINKDLAFSFCNKAFSSCRTYVALTTIHAAKESDNLLNAFHSWIVQRGDELYGDRHFQDVSWSATTLQKRWRIISGTPIVASSLNACSIDHHISDSASLYNYRKATKETLPLVPMAPSPYQRLVDEFDWGSSTLGPIVSWPKALKEIAKSVICNSKPVGVFWGPERIVIYNAPYAELIPTFHPQQFGRSMKTDFPYWDTYELVCQEVESTMKTVSYAAQPGPLMERNGSLHETYFSYDYIPLFDDGGKVQGIYYQVTEVTGEVLSRSRMTSLLRLSSVASRATDQKTLWKNVLHVLEDGKEDTPMISIHTVGEQMASISSQVHGDQAATTGEWLCQGSVGWPESNLATSNVLNLTSARGYAPFVQKSLESLEPVVLRSSDGGQVAALLEGCQYKGVACTSLVICPLQLSSGIAVGSLGIVLNPVRPYDDDYKHFVRVMARQIEDALKLAVFLEAQEELLKQTILQAQVEQHSLSRQLERSIQKARESDLRFFNFAKQAPVGIYVLNPDGSIQFANDAWLKLIGISKEAVENNSLKPWLATVHPDDLQNVHQQWQSLKEGISSALHEWRVLRRSESNNSQPDVAYLRSAAYAEVNGDGSLKAVTGITIDYSIEVAHLRETNAKMEAALEAKRAQENFMDMVSHEMRNPLHAIIQCAEEAEDLLNQLQKAHKAASPPSIITQKCSAAIDTILYCGGHQKQLIDDVLTMSKLDSNLLTICPVPACPGSLIRQVLKMFESSMRASGIESFVQLENSHLLKDTQRTVSIDPGRTLQILINLVGNAVKFLADREKKELHISLAASVTQSKLPGIKYAPSSPESNNSVGTFPEFPKEEEVYVHFSVKDTGPGLSEEQMDALFTRFRQSSPRTHAQYGGSGLGLFISRQLTELHGGHIGVASKLDQGSTFSFSLKGRKLARRASNSNSNNLIPSQTLQMSNSETKAPPETQPERPEVSLVGRGVLIVEDNIINQQLLARQLRKHGMEVTCANHGEEALSILKSSTWWNGTSDDHSHESRRQYSIILCDLEMPVMDGKTCVRHIRQWQTSGLLHSHIPVFAVTGNARAFLQNALEWGFNDVVTKPFGMKTLLPLMQSYIETDRTEIHEGNDV